MAMEPTHKSFGQLCSLASPGNSPAGVLPGQQAAGRQYIADCLNHNLRFNRDVESVGLLGTVMDDRPRPLSAPPPAPTTVGSGTRSLSTRSSISSVMGSTGEWRVPGEFGKRVAVDKQNTTLYASDRDMFVFLADEDRRIEVAGRSLARGFFVWNSEVGDKTLGARVLPVRLRLLQPDRLGR